MLLLAMLLVMVVVVVLVPVRVLLGMHCHDRHNLYAGRHHRDHGHWCRHDRDQPLGHPPRLRRKLTPEDAPESGVAIRHGVVELKRSVKAEALGRSQLRSLAEAAGSNGTVHDLEKLTAG
jgi:hypothetical protein